MKTLVLMRHADAEDGFGKLDADRNLTTYGRQVAAVQAQKIAAEKFMPQICICSSALRTIETGEAVCRAVGFPSEQMRKEADLHNPHFFSLIEYLKNLPDSVSEVILINHNPALTQCINYFGGTYSGGAEPGTAVCLSFKTDRWKDIEQAGGTPLWHFKP